MEKSRGIHWQIFEFDVNKWSSAACHPFWTGIAGDFSAMHSARIDRNSIPAELRRVLEPSTLKRRIKSVNRMYCKMQYILYLMYVMYYNSTIK